MRVSLAEVQEAFDGLLAGQSHESVSAWAVTRILAVYLQFNPPDAEARIWDALTFLGGVDIVTDMAGSYLYDLIDIVSYRP